MSPSLRDPDPGASERAPDDKPDPTLDTAPAESEPSGDDRIRELIDEDYEIDRDTAPFGRKRDDELTKEERKQYDAFVVRRQVIPGAIAATPADTLSGVQDKIAYLLADLEGIGGEADYIALARSIGRDIENVTTTIFRERRQFKSASSLADLLERLNAFNAEHDATPEEDEAEMSRTLDCVTDAIADVVEWRCATPAELAKQFAVFREYEHMVFDSSRAALFANLTDTLKNCAKAEGGAE